MIKALYIFLLMTAIDVSLANNTGDISSVCIDRHVDTVDVACLPDEIQALDRPVNTNCWYPLFDADEMISNSEVKQREEKQEGCTGALQ